MISILLLICALYGLYKLVKTDNELWLWPTLPIMFIAIATMMVGTGYTKFNNIATTSTSYSVESIKPNVIKHGSTYYVNTIHAIKYVNNPVVFQNKKLPVLQTEYTTQYNWIVIPWSTSHTRSYLKGSFEISEVQESIQTK